MLLWLTFIMSQITNTSIRSNTGYGEIGGINLAEDNFGQESMKVIFDTFKNVQSPEFEPHNNMTDEIKIPKEEED